jgi:hypothetical protein
MDQRLLGHDTTLSTQQDDSLTFVLAYELAVFETVLLYAWEKEARKLLGEPYR